jgi:phage-related protein
MAGDFKIGAGLALDGEAEFKKAVTGINKDLSVLGSEMKKVTAQFDGNANSMEALTAKQDVYNKRADEQRKKIEVMTAALENAKKEFGENSDKVKDWQIKLNNAEADLAKTERALNETTAQIDNFGKESDEAGDNIEEAGKKASESGGRFEKLGGILKGAAVAMGAVAVAAGAAAVKLGKEVVKQFGELEQNLGGSEAVFGEYAKSIQKTGEEAYKNLGVSQSDYLATANKMGALFQGSGIEQQKSLELTEKAMQRAADMASVMGIDMQVALDSVAGAAKGNFTMMDNLGVAINDTALKAYAAEKGLVKLTDAEKSFADIGLDISELGSGVYTLDELGEVYNKLLDDLNKPYDKGRSAAIEALDSIGISLLDLQQKDPSKLFDKFVDGAEKAAKAADESSPVFTQAEKAELAMQMFFEKTQQYAGNFAKESTETISGSIGLLKAAIGSFTAGLGNADADMTNLTGNMVDAFQAVVANIVPIIENLVKALPDALSGILPAITTLLPTLLTTFTQLFKQVLEAIIKLLPTLIPVVVDMLMIIVGTITDNLPLIISGAMMLITALVEGLVKALPELIPAVIDAVLLIVDTLIDNIDMLIDASIAIIVALADGLIEAMPRLVDKIPEIIIKLVQAFAENMPKIVEAGIGIIVALGGALIKALPDLVKRIPEIITAIVKAVGSYYSKIFSIGKDIVKGIWEGIVSMATWIKDKVTGFFGGVVDGVKDFLGIKSPSKVFANIGKNMAAGLGVGFGDEMNGVAKKINESVPTHLNMKGTYQAEGIVNGLAAVMGGSNALGGSYTINVNIDGRTAASVLFDPLRNVAKQKGVALA